jgi:hypothetical protein
MPRRTALIWVATAVAVFVVAACFATSSSVLEGAIAATRYSARFSGLVLAFALVARASHPVALATRKAELTLSFVAAHGIHYSTVIGRAFVESTSNLRHFAIENLIVVLGGVALVGVVATTAKATSRAGTRTNAMVFYILWALLVIASGSRFRTSLPSAVVLVVLVSAMLWRVGSKLAERRVAPVP